MFPKVSRQDCQKVPENVCKPETRVKVVEVEEEVCQEEVVTTPKTTTTTTTRAPVTKAVVKPGRSYKSKKQRTNWHPYQTIATSPHNLTRPAWSTWDQAGKVGKETRRKHEEVKSKGKGRRVATGKGGEDKNKTEDCPLENVQLSQKKAWTVFLNHMTCHEIVANLIEYDRQKDIQTRERWRTSHCCENATTLLITRYLQIANC